MKRGEEEAERVQSKSLIQAEVKDTKVRSQYAHLCKSGKSNDDEFKGKEAAKRHKIQRKDVTLVFSMQRFQPCGLQLPQAKEENNTLQFLHGDPEIYIISPAGLGVLLLGFAWKTWTHPSAGQHCLEVGNRGFLLEPELGGEHLRQCLMARPGWSRGPCSPPSRTGTGVGCTAS